MGRPSDTAAARNESCGKSQIDDPRFPHAV
jgi:hypothetical protein